jgi:predicted NAD-dependent protein-ADP-ribosyltransferase YbiA (DUF1768 family)
MAKIILFNDNYLASFSNNYHASFSTPIGNTFNSVNQYIAYDNAIKHGKYTLAKKILRKKYVKTPKHFTLEQLERACFYKFSQNKHLYQLLLYTKNYIIAYGSKDTKLGIGNISRKISDWNGDNLLGATLMNVREKLKSIVK